MLLKHMALALEIVREAGDRARSLIAGAEVRRHKALDDIVIDGDLLVEDYVLDHILRAHPDHGFDSEERGRHRPDAEFVWVLDPIDGSKYYAQGIPLYAVSLALQREGEPVLGVVYLPETNQMFSAAAGEPARLNGAAIRCSSAERLEDCTVCLEIPSRNAPPEVRKRAWAILDRLVAAARRVRILGVGSIGLCFTAMGGMDAYVNIGSAWKLCDVAAGRVICERAGCLYLERDKRIVAAPPALAERLVEWIEE